MKRRFRIGVVGFGMAGGTAAYLLARDGHAATILEQADRLGPVGAGVLLQMSGQMVLKQLGNLDAVLARCGPIDALDARHLGGKTLIPVPVLRISSMGHVRTVFIEGFSSTPSMNSFDRSR